jgi:biopolymer transport protein ExbD
MAIGNNQNGGVFADINITPLTDIFLVLLIIFMVATAATIESAAHVNLPKVKSQVTAKPKGVTVMYTADNRIFVNNVQVSAQNLPKMLKSALANASEKLVVFQGDPTVILADMVYILDIARSAGAKQIAVAVAKLPGPDGGVAMPTGPVAPSGPPAGNPGL